MGLFALQSKQASKAQTSANSYKSLQPKLKVGKQGDKYEREADRVADEVMRMEPKYVGLSGYGDALQRSCACGGTHGKECVKCREKRLSLQRKSSDGLEVDSAPPIVYDVLRSPGQPLDSGTSEFMEPRFGYDFSNIRVHTDSQAAEASQVLNARAFTVGRNVFFGVGEYRPGNSAGQRLIAHELAHTMQQSHSAPRIQRFVSCTRVRMSLEECPRRESGEVQGSRLEPMIVADLKSPVEGILVANFGIGQSSLKSNTKKHPNWPHLISAMSNPGSQWKLLGLSDCHGDDRLNVSLRQDRADAVRGELPSAAANQVVSASAVPRHECITDNATKIDRALNRSVLIALESLEAIFEPDVIDGTRPVPKPKTQPTVDCSTAKKIEIAQAHPIAVAMVKKALNVLAQPKTPAIESLLKKYFNDASISTYLHVIAGFKKTLSGLESSVKIECENKGSLLYDRFCSSSRTTVTIAYVRSFVGFRVHLCEAAFGRSDLDLAKTFVHEFSHMFDFTDDKEYCANGCSPSLSRRDAYDNADSYSGFAKEAFLIF